VHSPVSGLLLSWLARTDPRDVARVESKTVIVTPERRDTVPSPPDGGVSQLGRWMSPEEWDKAMNLRFPGCMKGREAIRFLYSGYLFMTLLQNYYFCTVLGFDLKFWKHYVIMCTLSV